MKAQDDFLQTIEDFYKIHTHYEDSEKAKINKAWEYLLEYSKSHERPCGESFELHPLRVASILAKSKLDADCIVAGLLHECENVENLFGKEVGNIVKGACRITNLKIQNKTLQQADSVRKMLFAMIDDIRIILVKLADRLDRMRFLKNLSEEKQKSVATEVLEIWSPLANRLGMSSLKDELEDLGLKYTNPDAYEQIKRLVQLKKGERSVYLERAEKEIYKSAAKQNLEISISSRAKHFYSIYQKMRKRGKAPDEIYDLLALRIICKDTAACYSLIGIVHTLWKPMEGRFKDYIAMPKTNGYQSLHTTVMCEGFPLEIQIRTSEMHSVAEHGVASHWLYKKGKSKDSVSVENLSIINQLKALRAENKNDAELFAEIKDELLGDSIYVFTPQGDVRELPAGSTAIDFAYSIHSRIGETIVGAKADGNIIPLSAPLKNTQIIEILTNPQSHPTENQLHNVKTARARSKIRSWLLQNGAILGGQSSSSVGTGAVGGNGGTGTVSATGLVNSSITNLGKENFGEKAGEKPAENTEEAPIRIRIGDTTNFMVKSAKCCNPIYGDEIIGYISRGRGLIIHRVGCENFLRIPNVKERSVSVVWEEKPVTIRRKKA